MSLPTLPALYRRRQMSGTLSITAAGLLLPVPARAQIQSTSRVITPAQTAGPYYPASFPADVDEDLVRLRGVDARAAGTVAHISGRVLSLDGRPMAGAQVEIWQCDANGRYLHPRDRGTKPRDTVFQGYGRTLCRADGTYRFRTIRPVAYPERTPHIHFAVTPPAGGSLVTQMYVAGAPLNERDGLYASLRDPRQRAALTVRLDPAPGIEEGALAGTFDIVLAS
jgi:protocatechuate 3,4-dioxygenase beta subunit